MVTITISEQDYQRFKGLERANELLEVQKTNLGNSYQQVANQVDKLQASFDALTDERNLLTDRNRELSKANANKQQRINELEGVAKRLQAERDNYFRDNNELKDKNKSLIQEVRLRTFPQVLSYLPDAAREYFEDRIKEQDAVLLRITNALKNVFAELPSGISQTVDMAELIGKTFRNTIEVKSWQPLETKTSYASGEYFNDKIKELSLEKEKIEFQLDAVTRTNKIHHNLLTESQNTVTTLLKKKKHLQDTLNRYAREGIWFSGDLNKLKEDAYTAGCNATRNDCQNIVNGQDKRISDLNEIVAKLQQENTRLQKTGKRRHQKIVELIEELRQFEAAVKLDTLRIKELERSNEVLFNEIDKLLLEKKQTQSIDGTSVQTTFYTQQLKDELTEIRKHIIAVLRYPANDFSLNQYDTLTIAKWLSNNLEGKLNVFPYDKDTLSFSVRWQADDYMDVSTRFAEWMRKQKFTFNGGGYYGLLDGVWASWTDSQLWTEFAKTLDA